MNGTGLIWRRLALLLTLLLGLGSSLDLTTAYAWDGQNLLSQTVTNGTSTPVTTSYLHHGNTPLWEVGSQSGLQVYAHDPLGNISGLVGNLGTSNSPIYGYTRAFSYDSFGNVLQEQMGQLVNNQATLAVLAMGAGVPSSGLRYKGELYDASANQSYMRNRQYEPVYGRFAQVDPARSVHQ